MILLRMGEEAIMRLIFLLEQTRPEPLSMLYGHVSIYTAFLYEPGGKARREGSCIKHHLEFVWRFVIVGTLLF